MSYPIPSSLAARRGSALVAILVVTCLLVAFAGAALVFIRASVAETEQERRQLQALYAAEGGLNAGLARLALAYQSGDPVDPNVGTPDAPSGLQKGEFWVSLVDNGDDSLTITATGIAGRSRRTLEAVVEAIPPNPLEHAMFAGNFSGESDYELKLGGEGSRADYVTGDVYSGGDIVLEGDAEIIGDLSARGTISGAGGREGLAMDLPQLLEIDYSVYHDYDVASLFAAAPRLRDDAGGTAGQLPVTSPVHFLRLNPTDRASDVDATEKDDYFLEDPYEAMGVDRSQDGSDAFDVTVPAETNNSVIYVDGNLWLHNRSSFSFRFKNDGSDPTRLTFVVKGNVYFSDNLFYDDAERDGIAFLALSDPDVEDSGNVYFGDPVFGTMKFAESMFFAENNFVDANLDAAGSATVELRGSMTAGNQVAINRDYVRADGSTAHTKLGLTWDERQSNGYLDLPGIPMRQDHSVGYSIVMWREVPSPRNPVAAVAMIEVDSPADNVGLGEEIANDWRTRWAAQWGEEWKQSPRAWGRWGTP